MGSRKWGFRQKRMQRKRHHQKNKDRQDETKDYRLWFYFNLSNIVNDRVQKRLIYSCVAYLLSFTQMFKTEEVPENIMENRNPQVICPALSVCC